MVIIYTSVPLLGSKALQARRYVLFIFVFPEPSVFPWYIVGAH